MSDRPFARAGADPALPTAAPARQPPPAGRGSIAGFDAAYAGTPPWDIGHPQPALVRLADDGAVRGSVLDVGCGTGEHALMAAARGLDATGIDASPTAIGLAQRKAAARNLQIRFLTWDALDLSALHQRFDTVLDSGLFHVFDDDQRHRFVNGLAAAVPVGGRYIMLCFSDQIPGQFGPRRVSREEIRTNFRDGWHVLSIEATTMEGTAAVGDTPAWLSVIARS
ncbi:class I SAM-dependent methyltransferase [Planosporangium flavigriseum]|uniref:SAM-dependent methyltransferase n=1 Tax=Planosporangium flavigriseum TaxID=373681 RepID=A0A8J3PLS7_9ACTN|nr:class I SAM-dependent methyltransferase [Planosporangium flavigriseum]NJC65643.1 class I SAM-dependent methyltransferase [Planosporangium flavigriseum]GIG74806.1 SAM-dependent methyltransferase [Planosporangium flavigriseum]